VIDLGLRHAQIRDLLALLQSPHQISISLALMDMNHRFLTDMSDRLLTGQVNFDTTADVVRSADLNLVDPRGTLSINPDSPEDGAVFINRMIRITYSVGDPLGERWYHIPLFTGPIVKLERNDITVQVYLEGKERLAFANVSNPKNFRSGASVTRILKFVIEDVIGENRYGLRSLKKKVNKNISISRESVPWDLIKKFTKSVGLHPFYDGRGVLRCRRLGARSVFLFDDDWIVDRPDFTYDPTSIVNSVIVVGGKPKGSKNKIRVRKDADNNHPLSPRRLGRTNKSGDLVPRFYQKVIEDSNVKTKRSARARAKRELRVGLLQGIDIQATVLPMPLLEEGDIYRLRTDDTDVQARMSKWSIPLTHEGTMSLGKVKRVSLRSRRRRTKKRKKRGRK